MRAAPAAVLGGGGVVSVVRALYKTPESAWEEARAAAAQQDARRRTHCAGELCARGAQAAAVTADQKRARGGSWRRGRRGFSFMEQAWAAANRLS